MGDYIDEQLKRIQRKVELKEKLADGGAVLERLKATFKQEDPSVGYGIVLGMAATLILLDQFTELTAARREIRLMVDAARTSYSEALDERLEEQQKKP